MKSLIFLLFAMTSLIATGSAQSPKREFRAAWIATVANIDWPSKPGLPAVQQQQEFIRRIEELKALGCNAVIVQVRPAADALYASTIEPWSRYLTGKQGQPPFPYYDPLVFMIEQAHQRQMEFHAWINPFRALTESRRNPNPPAHITWQHPDWLISYGGKSYLDPGIPEAREYVLKVIMDIVNRYDIDGIHLDDYFYPYRIPGVAFGDNRSFARYGQGYANRDDWRRQNVNLFVSTLGANIRSAKPHVKFGISPFGVWRNRDRDPEGSPTRGGQTNYDDLFADVLLWMKRGWIDYLMPQLYWEHGHRLVAFDVLLPWWENHSYTRHMYYGLGVYRMVGARSGAWANTRELEQQLIRIRAQTAHPGYSLYSASNFDKLRVPMADVIAAQNRLPALPPLMKWIDSIPPPMPIGKAIYTPQGALLKWEAGYPTQETARYIVYRFLQGEPVNLNRTDRILSVLSGKEYLDADATRAVKATYVVTALDRLWNESAPLVISAPIH